MDMLPAREDINTQSQEDLKMKIGKHAIPQVRQPFLTLEFLYDVTGNSASEGRHRLTTICRLRKMSQ